MQKHYNYLTIDIDKRIFSNLRAIQFDTKSRYILVNLISNNVAYDLSDTTVKIYGVKNDKTIFFNNAVIKNAKEGQFEIELTNQALAVEGQLEIQVLIMGANGEKLTSNSFYIYVGKSIIDENAIESTNEFNTLTEGLKNLAEYDVYRQNVKNNTNKISEHDKKLDEHSSQMDAKANKSDLAATSNNLHNLELTKATKVEVDVERKRINSFTSLAQGSTTGDAELIDGRIGNDSITYSNIGDSIRNQIKYITKTSGFNLNFIQGIIWGNGQTADNSSYYMSSFYQLRKGQSIVVYGAGSTSAQQLIVQNGNQTSSTIINTFSYSVDSVLEFRTYAATQDCYVRVCGLKNKLYAYISYSRVDLNDRIDEIANNIKEINLLKGGVNVANGETIALDSFQDGAKYLMANGVVTTGFTGDKVTNYINILPNRKYKYIGKITDGRSICLYDTNNNVVYSKSGTQMGGSATEIEFTAPSNAVKGMFSVYQVATGSLVVYPHTATDEISVINEKLNEMTAEPSNPCDYKGTEMSMFKKTLFIGDSFTQGVFDYMDNGTPKSISDSSLSYVEHIRKSLGVAVVNKGDAGKTYKTWWDNHMNDDLSGFDCCILALGINDGYLTTNGWDTNSQTAMQNIIDKLKTQNSKIKIFVWTPPKYFDTVSYPNFLNTVNGIKAKCTENNLKLIDLNTYSYIKKGDRLYSPADWKHFNSYGYYVLAKEIIAYVSYIISKDLTNFNNLQFVNTNINGYS